MITNQKRLISYFNQSLQAYPSSMAQAVGWASKETQLKRFEVLCGIADLTDATLLDVGSGVGDFFDYLNGYRRVEYVGIDMHPSMIEISKKRFPNGEFLLKDLEAMSGHFDYVMCSGAFNLTADDHDSYLKKMIRKMASLAKKGVAFNVLSQYAPYHLQYAELTYCQPAAVFDFCMQQWHHVTLRHDYLPNDFTVYIYIKE